MVIDLHAPSIRSRDEAKGKKASISLARSSVRGRRTWVECDRTYLMTALELGLDRISIGRSEQPVVCSDPTRTYLFLPIAGENKNDQAPAPKVIRVDAGTDGKSRSKERPFDSSCSSRPVPATTSPAPRRNVRRHQSREQVPVRGLLSRIFGIFGGFRR